MSRRSPRRYLVLLATVSLTACVGTAAPDSPDDAGDIGPAAGMCAHEVTDCVDTSTGTEQEPPEGIADGEPHPGLGMCAPGVLDCVDMVVSSAE